MVEVNPSNNSIKMTRGDTARFTVVATKDGEVYTPEYGDKIRFAVKHDTMTGNKEEFSDAEPLILINIPIDTMLLEIQPSDTKSLHFGKYTYDIEITYADGTVDTFITEASFKLTPEVY